MKVVINVPGPVRGKGRPRTRVRGNFATIYTDKATANYESLVRLCGAEAMRGTPPIEGAVSVMVLARLPVPKSASRTKAQDMLRGAIRPTRKPDLDNIIKVLDALNGVVFKDDAQVCTLYAAKVYALTEELIIEVEDATGDSSDDTAPHL